MNSEADAPTGKQLRENEAVTSEKVASAESSPKNRLDRVKKRVNVAREAVTGLLRKVKEGAPEETAASLKVDEGEMENLGGELDRLGKKAASELGVEGDMDSPAESRDSKLRTDKPDILSPAEERMIPSEMAMYKAIEPLLQAINDRGGWRNELTASSAFGAVAEEDIIRGVKIDGPLAIAFGLDVRQLSDGSWTGRSVSFEDSLEIDEALAEFMGNNAHTPKPIDITDETRVKGKSQPVLKGGIWMNTIKEGHWPVAMVVSEDGGGRRPFAHDARETHRAITQFGATSTQNLLSEVASLDLKRVSEGRTPVSLDGEKESDLDSEDKAVLLKTRGGNLLDLVTDDSGWVLCIEDLLTSPKGSLTESIKNKLPTDSDHATLESLVRNPLLSGQIALLNYKSRETLGRNLTDDEARTATRDYVKELEAHLQKLRGSN